MVFEGSQGQPVCMCGMLDSPSGLMGKLIKQRLICASYAFSHSEYEVPWGGDPYSQHPPSFDHVKPPPTMGGGWAASPVLHRFGPFSGELA